MKEGTAADWLGKTVEIRIDRPLGSSHPKYPEQIYPVNYGYIPGAPGGDGEEPDVYLLGVDEPVTVFTAKVIAVIHRRDDVEDKLVAAPGGVAFSCEEIACAVRFQEQYYDTEIEMRE